MTENTRLLSFDFGIATLQGFNLPGGKNYLLRVAFWTTVLTSIAYILFGLPIFKALAEIMQVIMTTDINPSGRDLSPEVVTAIWAPFIRVMGITFLIGLFKMAIFASAETAIYRNLIHKEDRGFFPLTFGMDELRVLGTRIVVGLILYGVSIGIYTVAALIGALLIGIADATNSSILGAISGLLIFFVIIAAIAVFAWVAVRLAPSSAFSVKNRAFNPVASWKEMKGLVWPAVGSYLILYVVGYFILNFIVFIVFTALFLSSGIAGVLTQLGPAATEVPNFLPVLEYLTSARFLIPLALAAAITMFLTMLWYVIIWSMWGYFAKTDWTDPKLINDEAGEEIW